MKTLVIGNEVFTVHKSKFYTKENVKTVLHRGKNFCECYNKPSLTKVKIYNAWCEWAYDNHIQYFNVSSYSTYTFKLQGLYYCETLGKYYYVKITNAYNRLFEII